MRHLTNIYAAHNKEDAALPRKKRVKCHTTGELIPESCCRVGGQRSCQFFIRLEGPLVLCHAANPRAPDGTGLVKPRHTGNCNNCTKWFVRYIKIKELKCRGEEQGRVAAYRKTE